MGKLNPNKVGLSLGITFVGISVLCLLLVAILPLQLVIAGSNAIFHGLDVSSIAAKNITIGSAIAGIIEVFVIGYVAGAIFAFAYNKVNG